MDGTKMARYGFVSLRAFKEDDWMNWMNSLAKVLAVFFIKGKRDRFNFRFFPSSLEALSLCR